MKKSFSYIRKIAGLSIILAILFMIFGELAEAKGSRSGGGGGRSFGGSRSMGSPKPTVTQPSRPNSSFGGSSNRSMQSQSQSAPKGTSFGGTRMANNNAYTQKYGTPRKTYPAGSLSGVRGNYVVNHYGGFGDGLMMGYMMGSVPFYWHTPFHPAFYYSRPVYVNNPDGTVSAYPPTFSFGSLFLGLIVIAALIFISIWVIRKLMGAKRNQLSQSSFG